MPAQPLLDDPFLRAQWSTEFEAFQNGPESAALLERLRAWAARDHLTERASETAFIQRFFVETWGYRLQGDQSPDYTCRPQFEVGGAGQTELNAIIHRLYRLSSSEVAMVEAG